MRWWAVPFALALFLGQAVAAEVPTENFFHGANTSMIRAARVEERALKIVSSTDLDGVAPLIAAFQDAHPGIAVRYVEYRSSFEMYQALAAACERGEGLGDLSLSSAVDLQIRLVNDGCAKPHVSPQTAALPDWARWRDEVFGLTFEPAVIVYAKRDFPNGDAPTSRFALIDLLRQQPERFKGRVATYDITEAGVGYLFQFLDSRQASTHGRLTESLARAKVKLVCCTSHILDGLADGSLALGYNALGSYAVARAERGAPIGVILPSDYTLVLSRAAFIARDALEPELAGRFIDFALSPPGRAALSSAGRLLSVMDGEASLATPPFEGADVAPLRPIELAPRLLIGQDQSQRAAFLRDWARAIGGELAAGR